MNNDKRYRQLKKYPYQKFKVKNIQYLEQKINSRLKITQENTSEFERLAIEYIHNLKNKNT